MSILRSEGHEIYSMHVNRVSLSSFDTKHWIADDGVHTLTYRQKDINERRWQAEAVYLAAQPTVLGGQNRA